jgi:hypothetical protein
MIIATGSIVAAQAMTFAIPIGTLFAVCIWLFFQRRPSH